MIPYIDAKFMQLGCKYSLNFIYNKNTINSTVLFSFTPFKRDISNSSKHEVTSKSEYVRIKLYIYIYIPFCIYI